MNPAAPAKPQPDGDDWSRALARLRALWLVPVCALSAVAAGRLIWLTHHVERAHLEDLYVLGDLPVLLVTAAGLFALSAARWRGRDAGWLRDHPGRCVAVLAGLAGALVLFGQRVLHLGYPLSTDEFMAQFDAAIFAQGRLVAPVAPEWRAYVPALQPYYVATSPGDAAWTSDYLPVNALLRAGFAALGAPWLVGAMLIVLAVLALYGIARQIWPTRPEAGLVAALLLASSSQVLVTAMTPFAYTAHLALNLAWLWLFLRPGKPSQCAAAAVACLACGLHQLIFHPLFAAPFVLQLWLGRHWRRALFHTAAYGAIALAWISYQPLLMRGSDGPAPRLGAGHVGSTAAKLLEAANIADLSVMSENLLRLVAWQHPLLLPLALLGASATWRLRGTLQALSGGVLLTLLAVALLMPTQSHAWGYRYLHGVLGNACLLATCGWMRLSDRLERGAGRAAWQALLAATLAALAMLPYRAWQVSRMERPYAAASAAIAAAPADIVVVDTSGIVFGPDLARNDPFLRNSPKVMVLARLDAERLRALCARYRVALFAAPDAARYGVPIVRAEGARGQASVAAGLSAVAPACSSRQDGR